MKHFKVCSELDISTTNQRYNIMQLLLRYFGLGTTLTQPSEHTYKYEEQSKKRTVYVSIIIEKSVTISSTDLAQRFKKPVIFSFFFPLN